jgi:homoserine dehydrogenase
MTGRIPVPTNIVGMAHRDGNIFDPRGIGIQNDPRQIRAMQARDIDLASQGLPRTAFKELIKGQEGYRDGANILDLYNQIVDLGEIDNVVFVDATASDLTDFHTRVIDEGGKLVTANKIPVAQCSWDIFRLLTEFREKYGYRATVMAGAKGALPFLRDSFDANDTVSSIEGCLSGTLGKLCNLLHEGKVTFSEAIKQLKLAGDTEPDPRDDLNGEDVAKKIVILARTAGYNVDLKDVFLDPFIPGGFGALKGATIDEFMEKCSVFDQDIAARFRDAKGRGKILKYVASMTMGVNGPFVKLGLREEDLGSPLGSLSSANKLVVHTSNHDLVPYAVEAQGSGTRLTAGNIRQDLSGILPNLRV